jgi:hypothetical protein
MERPNRMKEKSVSSRKKKKRSGRREYPSS